MYLAQCLSCCLVERRDLVNRGLQDLSPTPSASLSEWKL